MRVAVFGASGFIGRRLVHALAAAGHDAIAISSSRAHFDEESGLLKRDLGVEGPVDAIVYLSQSPRYRDVPAQAPHLWNVNVVSAIAAAEWGRTRGATQVVYASSGTVYSPSFHAHAETDPLRRDRWYALSKVHAEESLQQFQGDLDVTCARFFGVYGPGQRGKLIPNLVDTIRAGKPVLIHPQPGRRDADGVRLSLIHLNDAADALVKLLEVRRAGPINVASPEVLTIRQIAEAIGGAAAVPPAFEIAGTTREGDVIADASQLVALMRRPFQSFASAIGEVVAVQEDMR